MRREITAIVVNSVRQVGVQVEVVTRLTGDPRHLRVVPRDASEASRTNPVLPRSLSDTHPYHVSTDLITFFYHQNAIHTVTDNTLIHFQSLL